MFSTNIFSLLDKKFTTPGNVFNSSYIYSFNSFLIVTELPVKSLTM
jgi:hypothetical protein